MYDSLQLYIILNGLYETIFQQKSNIINKKKLDYQ